MTVANVTTIHDVESVFQPSSSDKVILLAVREHIRIQGFSESQFLETLTELNADAMDEWLRNSLQILSSS